MQDASKLLNLWISTETIPAVTKISMSILTRDVVRTWVVNWHHPLRKQTVTQAPKDVRRKLGRVSSN